MTPTDLLNAFFNGLSFSSILILAALGLAITFGVMRVINMAHGDMLMLGAYTAYIFTNPKVFNYLTHKVGSWFGFDLDIYPWIHFKQSFFGLDLNIQIDFTNLYWALPISFLVVGTIGYLLEVFLIRHLYGRPLDTLLATWGVGLVLQQSVILLLGPDLKPLDLPEEVRGNLQLTISHSLYRLLLTGVIGLVLLGVYALLARRRLAGPKARLGERLGLPVRWVTPVGWLVEAVAAAGAAYLLVLQLYGFPEVENPALSDNIFIAIPYYRMFILGVTVLCLVGVYLWFFRTSSGLKIRAVTQNRSMAAAMGISTRRVDALTFAFGTGLAGVAGCLLGHLYNVKADMGNSYIIEAFMVVILGGMGSLWGTIVAGIIIGTGKSVLAKFLSTSAPEMIRQVDGPMAEVGVWLVVITFIMLRPSGLFAARERVYD